MIDKKAFLVAGLRYEGRSEHGEVPALWDPFIVWLKGIKDLPEMEKLFRNHFEEGRFPARMTATTEFIDADCLIMIDGVAYAPFAQKS